MHRLLVLALLTVILVAPAQTFAGEEAASDDAEQGILFYGIVTVRDGETIFILNADLTAEQAELCAQEFAESLDLEREFKTDGLHYTWGEKEGTLTKEGRVPYIAYFLTLAEYEIPLDEIQFEDVEIEVEPPDRLCHVTGGFNRGRKADIRWWAPEATEHCSISFMYSDITSYKSVAVLKDEGVDKLVEGTKGTSPDGVEWQIMNIAKNEHGHLRITVEKAKDSKHHRFGFLVATESENRMYQPWPWKEDGETIVYRFRIWAREKDQVLRFEILERNLERAKRFEVKNFRFEPE